MSCRDCDFRYLQPLPNSMIGGVRSVPFLLLYLALPVAVLLSVLVGIFHMDRILPSEWINGKPTPAVMLPICLLLILFFLYIPAPCIFLLNRIMRWRLARAICLRNDAIVNPNSPKALFVEILTSENWYKQMLSDAVDVGFLLVDHNASEIRFEGDRCRMRIRAGHLSACEDEIFEMPYVYGRGLAPLFIRPHFLVLRLKYSSEEFLIGPRDARSWLWSFGRARKVHELRQKIYSLHVTWQDILSTR